MIVQYLAEIQLFEDLESERNHIQSLSTFLTMYVTNQKLSFDIFTIGTLQNIFMEHDLYLIS